VARDAGCSTTEELVQRLRSEPVGNLHQRVIEALATHETSFFRDPRVFNVLSTNTLPQLVNGKRKVVIWSAACSTGQEPYSIAIALLELFPDLDRGSVEIRASDLSQHVLDRAIAGVYSPLELGRGLSQELRERYFEPAGEHWRVKDRVRDLVTFQRLNLAGPWPWMPLADLVLLRNVLIYFDQSTRLRILERMRRSMHTGGYLVLGTSETAIEGESFKRLIVDGVVMYRIFRTNASVPNMPSG
jgi:chemotaxis protein methyltransferase CheR